jgi:hypothetical protein
MASEDDGHIFREGCDKAKDRDDWTARDEAGRIELFREETLAAFHRHGGLFAKALTGWKTREASHSDWTEMYRRFCRPEAW